MQRPLQGIEPVHMEKLPTELLVFRDVGLSLPDELLCISTRNHPLRCHDCTTHGGGHIAKGELSSSTLVHVSKVLS